MKLCVVYYGKIFFFCFVNLFLGRILCLRSQNIIIFCEGGVIQFRRPCLFIEGSTGWESRSNFFYFHAVVGKMLPNKRFLPQTQGLIPPPGKSWIRHCCFSKIFFYRTEGMEVWITSSRCTCMTAG